MKCVCLQVMNVYMKHMNDECLYTNTECLYEIWNFHRHSLSVLYDTKIDTKRNYVQYDTKL
jgi:hypothetical protein